MKKVLSYILIICVIFTAPFGAAAREQEKLTDEVLKAAAEYVYETVPDPQVGSVGGEWAVFALARSGYEIPDEYYCGYYKTAESYVKEHNGVLSEKKYTEYARVIIALTAIGKDPSEIGGYNLLMPLGDYEKTILQGINGAIWALIALDGGNYEIPLNSGAVIQATRDMYIDYILSCQKSDGGWAMSGEADASDPDITGMALTALAKYRGRADVSRAVEEALTALSAMQNETGGYSSGGSENSESAVWVMTALSELSISVSDDRFIKNGKSVLDYVLGYYVDGAGFKHTKDDAASDRMAAEQCLYGLAAVKRMEDGKNSLFDMSDHITIAESTENFAFGLRNKDSDISFTAVKYPGKTFSDIYMHENRQAIEALAARGIINGKSDDVFEPDATMTRAEFAAVVVRGLGLPEKTEDPFADVSENDWFFEYIKTAYAYGIVSGVSDTEFDPYGIITREEAAAMVSRAAALCGMSVDMDISAVRDVLAGFVDYTTVSVWAGNALAFCYANGILDDSGTGIAPQMPAARAEIAQMLFNMMGKAELL